MITSDQNVDGATAIRAMLNLLFSFKGNYTASAVLAGLLPTMDTDHNCSFPGRCRLDRATSTPFVGGRSSRIRCYIRNRQRLLTRDGCEAST